MHTRIVRCTSCDWRLEDGSPTGFFKLDIGRLGLFIKPADMPPFEGKEGLVEIMGPSTFAHVLRQVQASDKTRELTNAERRVIYLGTRKAKPVAHRAPLW